MAISTRPMLYIGTSGWQYRDWNGVVYPDGMKPADQLAYYAMLFNTVEINSTFYHMPRTTTTEKWHDQVPEHFRFTLKLNRYLTHTKRLLIDDESHSKLDEFITPAHMLRNKLGMVLVQLPPSLRCDIERLRSFLVAVDGRVPLAFECRHASWFEDEVTQLLDKYHVAWVVNDSPDRWPSRRYVVGRQLYIRFHGNRELYKSSYTDDELRDWAKYIASQDIDTAWVYFNNDYNGVGPENATRLLGYCRR